MNVPNFKWIMLHDFLSDLILVFFNRIYSSTLSQLYVKIGERECSLYTGKSYAILNENVNTCYQFTVRPCWWARYVTFFYKTFCRKKRWKRCSIFNFPCNFKLLLFVKKKQRSIGSREVVHQFDRSQPMRAKFWKLVLTGSKISKPLSKLTTSRDPIDLWFFLNEK